MICFGNIICDDCHNNIDVDGHNVEGYLHKHGKDGDYDKQDSCHSFL